MITATAAKAVDAGSSILLLPLRVLQRVLLGKLPEKATSGSFQETKVKRRGGLLTFWRRQPEVVEEEAVVAEVEEDELDPEVEANQRLRDELEEELRAKIQAQAAIDGGMTPPDGDDEWLRGGRSRTPRWVPSFRVPPPPPLLRRRGMLRDWSKSHHPTTRYLRGTHVRLRAFSASGRPRQSSPRHLLTSPKGRFGSAAIMFGRISFEKATKAGELLGRRLRGRRRRRARKRAPDPPTLVARRRHRPRSSSNPHGRPVAPAQRRRPGEGAVGRRGPPCPGTCQWRSGSCARRAGGRLRLRATRPPDGRAAGAAAALGRCLLRHLVLASLTAALFLSRAPAGTKPTRPPRRTFFCVLRASPWAIAWSTAAFSAVVSGTMSFLAGLDREFRRNARVLRCSGSERVGDGNALEERPRRRRRAEDGRGGQPM